ncbi:MAG: septum site-determining protein MinC [Pseudomonadota bacterium]
MKPSQQILDIKSTQLPSLVLWIKTLNVESLALDIKERVEQTPDFFNDEPVILDVSTLTEEAGELPFHEWLDLCRQYRMVPVGCRGGNAAQTRQAQSLGLALLPEGTRAPETTLIKEIIKEIQVPVPMQIEIPVPTRVPTQVLDKHLRSGQQFYAKNCDLIVLAPVAAGAEVISDGNIHVYSPLRGKAIAGAQGDRQARIFVSSLEAELVSIAGVYRTLDIMDQQESWHGKTACISLTSEQRLHIQPLSS